MADVFPALVAIPHKDIPFAQRFPVLAIAGSHWLAARPEDRQASVPTFARFLKQVEHAYKSLLDRRSSNGGDHGDSPSGSLTNCS